MSRPAVSVVIPLYNKDKYIARALDSVLAQTYHNFEVVVIDDGSTDNGPDTVRQYNDSRVRLVQQANAGPGAARNRGIQESRAPLLAFLDADDEWLPEFLGKSIERLESHPGCVLTIAGYYQGPERRDMAPILRGFGITTGPWRLPAEMPAGDIKHAIDFFNSWAILCRRDILERYGNFYAKDRHTYGEDTYLWLQVALNHEVYRDPAPLVWFHSEASNLGYGRKTVHPPRSILSDPELIRKRCPTEYRALLERCLAYYALLAARRHARAGDSVTTRCLLRKFPAARDLGWDYVRIRTAIFCMSVFRVVASSPVLLSWIRRIRGFGSRFK